jgi:hypothetical protein
MSIRGPQKALRLAGTEVIEVSVVLQVGNYVQNLGDHLMCNNERLYPVINIDRSITPRAARPS